VSLEKILAIARASGPLAVAVGVILYLVVFPDKAQQLTALLYTAVSWVYTRFRSRARGKRIESRINSACEKLARQHPEVVPHPIRLQWVGDDHDEVLQWLERDGLIVCVHGSGDEAGDTHAAAAAVVHKGVLKKARSYIPKSLMTAVDMAATHMLLAAIGDPEAYAKFAENLEDALSDQAARGWFNKLAQIEDRGYFTRILLPELNTLGERRFGAVPDDDTRVEAEEFTNFVHAIASRERGEEVRLSFRGRTIRAAVILFTKAETLQEHGLDAHVHRVELCLDSGIERFYLAALDSAFAPHAKTVAARCYSAGLLQEERTHSYEIPLSHGSPEQALIISARRCRDYVTKLPKKRRDAHQPYDEQEIRDALDRYVPAVENRQVVVTDVVSDREAGLVKVGIACAHDSRPHAVNKCLGPGGEYVEALQEILDCRYLTLVDMQADLQSRVRRALRPFPADEIVSIRESRDAVVVLVDSPDGIERAVGSGGANQRLAEVLLGVRIKVRAHTRLRRDAEPQ